MGSAPSEVNSSLHALKDTFLRCAPKPGSIDTQVHWIFHHPTLREGFASYIADNVNFQRLLIEGLDDDGVLTQLDCGSGATRGTLVIVQPTLYSLVAHRILKIRETLTRSDLVKSNRWFSFLSGRCSKELLQKYMSIDDDLIDYCLDFGSYMSVVGHLDVLARLHYFDLLSEKQREEALANVGDLAVRTPDADWLDIPGLDGLFTEKELAGILDRVRHELVPNLDKMLRKWEITERGDSAEEYYYPLKEALERYMDEFLRDHAAFAAIERAIAQVDEQEASSLYWERRVTEDEPSQPRSISTVSASWAESTERDTSTKRDIFDDVDADYKST